MSQQSRQTRDESQSQSQFQASASSRNQQHHHSAVVFGLDIDIDDASDAASFSPALSIRSGSARTTTSPRVALEWGPAAAGPAGSGGASAAGLGSSSVGRYVDSGYQTDSPAAALAAASRSPELPEQFEDDGEDEEECQQFRMSPDDPMAMRDTGLPPPRPRIAPPLPAVSTPRPPPPPPPPGTFRPVSPQPVPTPTLPVATLPVATRRATVVVRMSTNGENHRQTGLASAGHGPGPGSQADLSDELLAVGAAALEVSYRSQSVPPQPEQAAQQQQQQQQQHQHRMSCDASIVAAALVLRRIGDDINQNGTRRPRTEVRQFRARGISLSTTLPQQASSPIGLQQRRLSVDVHDGVDGGSSGPAAGATAGASSYPGESSSGFGADLADGFHRSNSWLGQFSRLLRRLSGVNIAETEAELLDADVDAEAAGRRRAGEGAGDDGH